MSCSYTCNGKGLSHASDDFKRVDNIFDLKTSQGGNKLRSIFVVEAKRMNEGGKPVNLENHLPQVISQCIAV